MSEEQAPGRADCPTCGRNVAVTKSGALRKHACAPAAVPAPAVRRYCRVPNCGRRPRGNGLCASHRLRTYLVS